MLVDQHFQEGFGHKESVPLVTTIEFDTTVGSWGMLGRSFSLDQEEPHIKLVGQHILT